MIVSDIMITISPLDKSDNIGKAVATCLAVNVDIVPVVDGQEKPVGAVLISRGAGYAFAVGIVLCLLVYGKDFFRNWNKYDKVKDPVFNKCIAPEPDEDKHLPNQ